MNNKIRDSFENVRADDALKSRTMAYLNTKTAKPNVACQCAKCEEAAAVQEAGLSLGKYRVPLELQTLDPKTTADDVRTITMRQIRTRLAELSHQADEAPTESGSCENGSGNGHGNGKQHGKNG